MKYIPFLLILITASFAQAQIYRWDTHQLIPGTQNITPAPGVNLTAFSLEYANLANVDLYAADLVGADLYQADFTGSNLTYTLFNGSILKNANLSGANITAADFSGTNYNNPSNFTESQLDSTINYQNHDLQSVRFQNDAFIGWNFAGQNLTNSSFSFSTLLNDNFTGAIIKEANFSNTLGFTDSLLYPTASYAQHDLTGIGLNSTLLFNLDLSNQNLTNASFSFAILAGTRFDGAIITGANFGHASGFTSAQLYSTASYQSRDLHGITLVGLSMDGSNLANQNLSDSNFNGSNLSYADFSHATLYQAILSANFHAANLSHADLTSAYIATWNDTSDFTDANFTGALLSNAIFHNADLRGATGFFPDASTTVTNTILPDGTMHGLVIDQGENFVLRNDSIPISIDAPISIDSSATLTFILRPNWTSTIHFTSNIVPTLGGTLDLEFLLLIDPNTLIGQTFQLFDWNTSLSSENHFDSFLTSPGLHWDLSNLYTTGTVTLLPEPVILFTLLPLYSLIRPSRSHKRRVTCTAPTQRVPTPPPHRTTRRPGVCFDSTVKP